MFFAKKPIFNPSKRKSLNFFLVYKNTIEEFHLIFFKHKYHLIDIQYILNIKKKQTQALKYYKA